jgi:hypothetical protein
MSWPVPNPAVALRVRHAHAHAQRVLGVRAAPDRAGPTALVLPLTHLERAQPVDGHEHE